MTRTIIQSPDVVTYGALTRAAYADGWRCIGASLAGTLWLRSLVGATMLIRYPKL